MQDKYGHILQSLKVEPIIYYSVVRDWGSASEGYLYPKWKEKHSK